MQMGREKRDKGKATVLEPPQKKKRSREKREHDAAERVADAFDAMQSRHARGISIEEPRQNPPRSARPPPPPVTYRARTKRVTSPSQPRQRQHRGLVSPDEIIAEQEAEAAAERAA